MSSAAFGMMEGAYFVGRVELLAWINDFLKLNYKKVEQFCSASAYCQIMDALHPGKIALSKVNFDAKFDYEFTKNFVVLQAAFTKIGIEKNIDVPILTKGKFQDNLEFCQWMKKYFDMHYSGEPYDAVGRRNAAIKAAGGKSSVKSPTSANSVPKKAAKAPAPANLKTAASPAKKATPPAKAAPTPAASSSAANPFQPRKDSGGFPPAQKDQSAQVQRLEEEIEELKRIATEVETERDFYFKKLRQVELECQQTPEEDLSKRIFAVLSSAEDADVEADEFALGADDEGLLEDGIEGGMEDEEETF